MEDTNRIKPGLVVHARSGGQMKGAAGEPVGMVDHLEGTDYIKLTRSDSTDGRHHWIPCDWVESVDDKAVYLNKTPDEFRNGLFDNNPVRKTA
jgi:hypothetical protein